MENITLSVFVPCFNEEKNITQALNNIKEAIKNIDYEILVTDDASEDNTVEVVENFKKNNPNLNIKIFRNKKNQGLGYNYYATAFKALGKYYMLVCGDASEPPDTIKKIVSYRGKADMIIAYMGENDTRTLLRKMVSKIFVIILNLITFNNLKYYNGPGLHLVENIKLYGTGTFGFGYQAELISALMIHKKTFIEVQIKHNNRQWGNTTAFTLRNILNVIRSIIIIFLNQISYVMKKFLK